MAGKVLEGRRGLRGDRDGGCSAAASWLFPSGSAPGVSSEGKYESCPGCCFQLDSAGMKENAKNGTKLAHSLVSPLWWCGDGWRLGLFAEIHT